MRPTTPKIFVLLALLTFLPALAGGAAGQEAPPAADAPVTAATERPAAAEAVDAAGSSQVEDDSDASYLLRDTFSDLLRRHPPELATVLALDPSLLANDEFLAGYPQLARFVAQHPEVRRSPRFYLAHFRPPGDNAFSHLTEAVTILGVFLFTALTMAWLIRTAIEHQRWKRLSRIQSEVHNKILERFGTSEALLEYMRSPAGSKFLESAPIPIFAERPVRNVPLSRAVWSVQLGLVVVAGAIGMLVVSGRFAPETAEGMYALGMIALCIGIGFVASAFVSLVMSRRLGLWQDPAAPREDAVEDSGFGR